MSSIDAELTKLGIKEALIVVVEVAPTEDIVPLIT
jgi:hypothetical protein